MQALKFTDYISNQPVFIISDKILSFKSCHDYTNEGSDYTQINVGGEDREPLSINVKETEDEIVEIIKTANSTK
ncbi:MAG: hypothetical protein BGO31_19725 [Bacteroidetes bacterium 43-16]|uniref:hypothetical protein n=1 Tax=uncultured Flavobacterium sp. TaxID=165435 RepID=UPI0009292EFC|nr:hypothetical protein [uncultured Flavobacterium sp.]OJV55587.1 MAG: hypothetical protein BGO31_19725 [Bacteroidetes bacterium 43-16]